MASASGGNTERSGGTRFSANKPGGFWYAPLYGLRLVAEVWEFGSKKYAPCDWRNGQSFSTLLDCAFRHMLAVNMEGPLARDSESGAYHAAHAVWNLLTLLTFIALGRHDLDDVTGWQEVTTAVKNAKGYSFANPPPSPDVEVQLTHPTDGLRWDEDAGSYVGNTAPDGVSESSPATVPGIDELP